MTTLAIAVTGNKNEFVSQARLFQSYWSARGERVDLVVLEKAPQSVFREGVQNALGACKTKIDRVAFFCHGTPRALLCGYKTPSTPTLAAALRRVCTNQLTVALYSCSTGRTTTEWPWTLAHKSWTFGAVTPGAGFAVNLLNELRLMGVSDASIFAHASKGHTTRNPYCYGIELNAPAGLIDRFPLVEKGGPLWKNWIEEMQTDRRFEVPFE